MTYKVMHDLAPAFSLTSSHTPLHFAHSVSAIPNFLVLEYVELILAPGFFICWSLSLEWSLIFWYGSAPSPFPDLCSDYTAVEKPFLPALYIIRVLISTWLGIICWFIHLFIHLLIHSCEWVCVNFHF